MEKLLIQANIAKIGEVFHDHWLEKKKLTKNMSNQKLNKIYEKMMKSKLFYGGKIVGAGGGGFFLMASKYPNTAIKLKFSSAEKFWELIVKKINTIIKINISI